MPRGEFNATVLDDGRGVAAVAFVVTVMAVAAAARRRAGAQWEHQHLVWFDGFHVGCYGGFDLDDVFHWDGDESGADYVDESHKSNKSVSLYPSCSSVSVSFNPHLTPLALPTAAPFSIPVPSNSPSDAPSTHRVLNLLHRLNQLIQRDSRSSIGVSSSKG